MIDGWVLITGAGLPDIGTNKSASKKWLIGLSIEFSEVQYFSTHRVVEYHAWVKAQNGSIKRFHEYLGVANETLTSEGELSEFEMGLNLLNTNIHDPEDDTPESPGEETVMEIAGDWSVNPCTLDDREDLSATGWMGYINRP